MPLFANPSGDPIRIPDTEFRLPSNGTLLVADKDLPLIADAVANGVLVEVSEPEVEPEVDAMADRAETPTGQRRRAGRRASSETTAIEPAAETR